MKVAESLATDWLAIIRTQVVSVSEGSLAGETKERIVPNIEGSIEKGLNVSVDWTCISDLFDGYFELKLGEN